MHSSAWHLVEQLQELESIFLWHPQREEVQERSDLTLLVEQQEQALRSRVVAVVDLEVYIAFLALAQLVLAGEWDVMVVGREEEAFAQAFSTRRTFAAAAAAAAVVVEVAFQVDYPQ